MRRGQEFWIEVWMNIDFVGSVRSIGKQFGDQSVENADLKFEPISRVVLKLETLIGRPLNQAGLVLSFYLALNSLLT